jgi:NAD(P)-dependent dehydrogenase (short-subunit alcohol dehydrogenase family)
MSDLSGKTALITGALTGIGRATALAFAQEGSRVVVSGRRDDAGQLLVAELRAQEIVTEVPSVASGDNHRGRSQ